MKRIFIAAMLAITLLLSACKAAPQPVYDSAPEPADQTVYINGIALKDLRTADRTLYWNPSELTAILGASWSETHELNNHTATLTINGITRQYAAGEECPADMVKGFYTGTDWYLPLDSLPEELGYHSFSDEERSAIYYTAYPLASEIPTGTEVPTLMYHAVSDQCWGIESLFVSPEELEKQLQYLQENGFTTVTFEDLGKIDTIEKPVMLTFDDGYDDNYTNLFPLLKKYNAKATVFLITGSIGAEHYLTEEQVLEMDASGLVSFQSHTVTHEFLSTRTADQLQTELGESKKSLAALLGKEPFVLCYPSGRYSEASLEATGQYYQYGLLMNGETYETGDNPLMITRSYVSRSTTLDQFKNMVN